MSEDRKHNTMWILFLCLHLTAGHTLYITQLDLVLLFVNLYVMSCLLRISAASISFPALQRSRVPRRAVISCLATLAVSTHKRKQLSVCRKSSAIPAAAIRKSLQQLPLSKFGVSSTQISTVSVPGIFSAATCISRQLPELSSCSSLY